jgi:hypothetical protein
LQVQKNIIIPVKPPKTNILVAKTTAEWLYLGAGGLPVVTTLLNMNAESRISVFVDGTAIIILLVFSISGINSTGLIIFISTHSYVRKYSFQCDSNKQYSRLSRGMADTIRDDPHRPIQYK